VEWRPARVIVTDLDLGSERFTTRLEFADAGRGGAAGTDVTITITRTAARERLRSRMRRPRGLRRFVEQTVAAELERLPAHLDAGRQHGYPATGNPSAACDDQQPRGH
jgi:hypothetical protein